MKYQKVINLLDNTPNQPSKFKIKNLVKINDGVRGTYNVNNQTKLKTSMSTLFKMGAKRPSLPTPTSFPSLTSAKVGTKSTQNFLDFSFNLFSKMM